MEIQSNKSNANVKTMIVEVDVSNYEKLMEIGTIKIKWHIVYGVDVMRC